MSRTEKPVEKVTEELVGLSATEQQVQAEESAAEASGNVDALRSAAKRRAAVAAAPGHVDALLEERRGFVERGDTEAGKSK